MRNQRSLTFFGFALLLATICLPFAATAQTVLTANGTEYTMTVNTDDTFRVFMEGDHSYCCTVLGTDTASDLGLDTAITDSESNNFTGDLRGDVTPRVTVNVVTDTSATDNRICFSPTASRIYIFTIDSAKMGGESVKLSCEKTSLLGSFNTNSTPLNFLECSNDGNTTITAKVYAEDFEGDRAIDGTEFTFSSEQRRDIDIHTSAGDNKFGRLWVTHDGPRAALRCDLSQYEADLEFKGTNPLHHEAS